MNTEQCSIICVRASHPDEGSISPYGVEPNVMVLFWVTWRTAIYDQAVAGYRMYHWLKR